jgi:hypothetical protein
MRPTLFLPVFSLFLAMSLPAAAEEFLLKDGTKIVGHMSALQADKIEVETAYGKMQLKRSDIIAINFPENGTVAATGSPAAKDAAQNIEESLRGTQYVNKTGKFTLTVPADWKIDAKQPRSAPIVTILASHDDMRFLTVTQEEYSGSLESYKGMLEIKYRKIFGGYEALSESSAKIDGKSALLLSFRGISTKADNLPVQFLVAIIPSGATYTRVVTWCAEPLFHETQPMFEKIVNSYHSGGVPTVAQLAKP